LKYRVKLGSFVGSDPYFGLAGAIIRGDICLGDEAAGLFRRKGIERDIYQLFDIRRK
jgi:hypothetical protein